MVFEDLRGFLEHLRGMGDVLTVQEEVDRKFELSAVLRQVATGEGPVVVFENIRGFSGIRVVGNVLGSRRRVTEALGSPGGELLETFISRRNRPIEPTILDSGPVKEVVLTGGIDLHRLLPAPVFHEKDAGPYLTAGIAIARDPETGQQSMGIHRVAIKGKDRLGIFLANPPLAHYLARAEKLGRPLDIAIALGVDPLLMLASIVKHTPGDPDKFVVAGGLRGEAVKLVPGESVKVNVPAFAEIVLEGQILPGLREAEGPFGESTGHYFINDSPVIQVTAVTHRRNPLLQVVLPWAMEPDLLLSLGSGSEVYAGLKALAPKVKDLALVPGTCTFHAVVAVEEGASRGEVRRIINLALNLDRRMKQVTVVDDDVDIHDFREVAWAVATRFQADRDTLILTGLDSYVIDPSVQPGGATAKLGLDATKKQRGDTADSYEKIRVPGYARVRAEAILASTLRQSQN
ncbi:MAG: UbiD family decarboxylase [Clostridia bacterium]|nr:UbiD family decarboxylase [Clostridia bacterium]